MTDSGDAKNWSSNKNWIKDVLSKSGTELMDISKPTNKNGAAKKLPKNTGKDIHNKMVYYQAAPLIVKSEQSSQAQFCTPLQSHISTAQQPQQQLERNTNNNFNMHHQPEQTPSTSSIANLTNAPNHNFFANIKTELLTPNITLFAKSVAIPPISTGNSIMPTTAVQPTSNTSNAGGRRKTSGNKPQFKCEQCGMTFGSKSAHTSHTKSHKNGKLNMTGIARQMHAIEVNEAGIPLGIPKTPQINANNGSGDPYQCNVCQKTFAVPARLIRHYRTHTGERPFECEFCHKLFSVKENLQVHRRIHTKERPYKCDVCGRAFEHSGKLHRHMRIHTGERPHKCSVCEKTFIQSGQLVIHMRTHTGEKPYKCPVVGCGKGFTCSKQLKVHSRTHTGEKPYHCDICFRDFGYNHVLKLHRVQHYGSKCYKCTICEETFKSKKDMEIHIKGHAHELPDDEETVGGNGSSSSSSGGETTPVTSPPRSRKAIVKVIAKVKNPKQQRKRNVAAKTTIGVDITVGQLSPSSSRSTFSSTSSMTSAAALRQSASSPASSVASLSLETDYHSRDSGLASTSNNRQMSSSAAATLNVFNQAAYIIEEMPTDLSVQQEPKSMNYPQEQEQQLIQNNPVYQQQFPFIRHSPVPVYPQQQQQQHHHEQQQQQQQQHPEPLTINPALVASRRTLEPLEEQAALQMLQLHRSQKQPIHQPQQQQQQPSQINQQQYHHQIQIQPVYHPLSSGSPIPPQQHPMHHHVVSEMSHYDDTREANELIEHYKRGELARHGIHGYAPVPKFESALLNNEIIVRQVEAAIAPLRSSTESPERSSSPESDSMMMADRDVMTLPLRKRKLYMNEGPAPIPMDVTTNESESNNKGVRMSSVIQFAKAS